MQKDKPLKIVYNDGTSNRAVKGSILSEDEFTIDIKVIGSGDILSIGKRFIVMSRPLSDGDFQ